MNRKFKRTAFIWIFCYIMRYRHFWSINACLIQFWLNFCKMVLNSLWNMNFIYIIWAFPVVAVSPVFIVVSNVMCGWSRLDDLAHTSRTNGCVDFSCCSSANAAKCSCKNEVLETFDFSTNNRPQHQDGHICTCKYRSPDIRERSHNFHWRYINATKTYKTFLKSEMCFLDVERKHSYNVIPF